MNSVRLPNPDAKCIDPANVSEDNSHRVCSHCQAGVLAKGYCVANGEDYYCTAECFETADPELYTAHNEDPDGDADYDPDWCYWTDWEGEQ